MEWNGKNLLYFYTFSILAYFIVVFILSAVNEPLFDRMHKTIKEKDSSQRSIPVVLNLRASVAHFGAFLEFMAHLD